jgi:nucleotide-binding universal stress UspA family protein
MLPLKKILAPTDFSEPSFKGLRVANELAEHFAAELIVVNVVSPVHFVTPPGPAAASATAFSTVMKEMLASANTSIEKAREERVSQDILSRAMVLEGSAAEEIVRAAAEEKADVIVLATHGRTGWRRFILGSVSEKVVRLAECPVITIPVPEE